MLCYRSSRSLARFASPLLERSTALVERSAGRLLERSVTVLPVGAVTVLHRRVAAPAARHVTAAAHVSAPGEVLHRLIGGAQHGMGLP